MTRATLWPISVSHGQPPLLSEDSAGCHPNEESKVGEVERCHDRSSSCLNARATPRARAKRISNHHELTGAWGLLFNVYKGWVTMLVFLRAQSHRLGHGHLGPYHWLQEALAGLRKRNLTCQNQRLEVLNLKV